MKTKLDEAPIKNWMKTAAIEFLMSCVNIQPPWKNNWPELAGFIAKHAPAESKKPTLAEVEAWLKERSDSHQGSEVGGMSESGQIDCDYTRELICPHCGVIKLSSPYLEGGDGEEIETECPECDKAFKCCRNVRVTWTSWKPTEKQP